MWGGRTQHLCTLSNYTILWSQSVDLSDCFLCFPCVSLLFLYHCWSVRLSICLPVDVVLFVNPWLMPFIVSLSTLRHEISWNPVAFCSILFPHGLLCLLYLVTSIYQSACWSCPVLALSSFYFYLFCPSDPNLKDLFDIPRPQLINLHMVTFAYVCSICYTAREAIKIVPNILLQYDASKEN